MNNEPEISDLLISRIVDRRASRADWDVMDSIAAASPRLWHELGVALRNDAALTAEVGRQTAVAAHIALPEDVVPDNSLRASGRFGLRTLRISAWSGWAAAALVALAFFGANRNNTADTNQAGILPDPTQIARSLSTDQLRDLYLSKGEQEGRVIGQSSSPTVNKLEQLPDGTYRIVITRQIVEVLHTDNLYRMTNDESGQPVSIPLADSQTKKDRM